MPDISQTLEAKSDQLNAVDIIGAEPVIKIRKVEVQQSPQQPLSIYFEGDNNKPWKPSKGMRRILAAAWGRNSDLWIGKSAKLFFEPSVTYGGEEVGGIRIRELSDIPQDGIKCALTISRTKRTAYEVPLLKIESNAYPETQFKKSLPIMKEKMEKKEMTLQQVIAQCQKTGTLSKEQLKELEKAAPVEDDKKTNVPQF
jgi:hypothetical protein